MHEFWEFVTDQHNFDSEPFYSIDSVRMRKVIRSISLDNDASTQIGIAMPRNSDFRELKISEHPMLIFFMYKGSYVEGNGRTIPACSVIAYKDTSETNYLRYLTMLDVDWFDTDLKNSRQQQLVFVSSGSYREMGQIGSPNNKI